MKKKKNMLILGGNSKKNIVWMKQMKKNYESNYNIFSLEYENWFCGGRMNFEAELKKISEIAKKKQIDIVLAKSIGMYLFARCINRGIIKPSVSILMGYPFQFFKEENMDIIEDIINFKDKTKLLLIQQESDPQCSAKLLEQITDNVLPIITISGNDHAYNQFITIKKYVDEFIKLNIGDNVKEVRVKSLEDAIVKIDKERDKYKYYNNWLSDPKTKILIFNYNKKIYIAKRVSKKNAICEQKNAKLLKNILEKEYNQYKINIPMYYPINSKNGYIVEQYYGKDLNQYYYDNKPYPKIGNLIEKTYITLHNNNIRYNGFLPRNMIVDKDKIFLIDFEDINQKDEIITETNIKIAWSYFIKSKFCEKIESNIKKDDKFNCFINKSDLSNYPNMHYVALKAESYNGDKIKMDDVINILSNYISYETELLLDIIMYEINENKLNNTIKYKLYALSQEVRVIELLKTKDFTKKYIKRKLEIILKNIICDHNSKLIKHIKQYKIV